MLSLVQYSRVVHRLHPEYGFGVIRYLEEDVLGERICQVSFDHLDLLQTVRPEELEVVATPPEDLAVKRLGRIEVFQRKLAAGLVLGENNLTGAFMKVATQPLPHQAFLLDKILSSNRFGHLLADDVGLGKTIEAGLVITSCLRANSTQKVLIVCPAGLAYQWQDELEDHFSLHFAILGTNFDGMLVASWRSQPFVIAPIDRLKRPQYRPILQEVGPFDLVICDEAHRLTALRHRITQELEKTANYKLVEFLVQNHLIDMVQGNDAAPRSPRLLLLSGTPHQGDDERFVYLLHLVRPDLFQPQVDDLSTVLTAERLAEAMTRTPKSRAIDWRGQRLFRGHVTRTVDVPWTDSELKASRLLTEYVLNSLNSAKGSDRANQLVVELVMHTFHKIAASSWAALVHTLDVRLRTLRGHGTTLKELEAGEDFEDDEGEVEVPDRAFFEEEAALLKRLLQLVGSIETDSKWDCCKRLLQGIQAAEAGAKVLVFTQYRATQLYLQKQIRSLFPDEVIELINGDTSLEERREARLKFETTSRFLVSTEAGGEGINLQRACHVMVNYDWPWNPMRLQQRIGRLDRYGQQHTVQVFNIRVPESWDNRISLRIMERLERIQKTMNLAAGAQVEDFNEMLLGQIASQVNARDLFIQSISNSTLDVADSTLDSWIKNATDSLQRWKKLFLTELGMPQDITPFRPSLQTDHFRLAFSLACSKHGLRLRESRNSTNQFVQGVFNFDLPDAFREPGIRPSRTIHVVFDRDLYLQSRGQDLGRVRGQPIRPVLAGFGEAVTDWLFQTSFHAAANESAFCIRVNSDWLRDNGWLLVFALRWAGSSRRSQTPDSLVVVLSADNKEPRILADQECFSLLGTGSLDDLDQTPPPGLLSVCHALAQNQLRKLLQRKDTKAKSTAGLSLLMIVRLRTI